MFNVDPPNSTPDTSKNSSNWKGFSRPLAIAKRILLEGFSLLANCLPFKRLFKKNSSSQHQKVTRVIQKSHLATKPQTNKCSASLIDELIDALDNRKSIGQDRLDRCLIGSQEPDGWLHEKQEPGLCGMHAVNNAIGKIIETKAAFRQKVLTLLNEIGFSVDAMPDGEFGVDGEQLRRILEEGELGIQTKTSKISDLPGFKKSKANALAKHVGNSPWFILYHNNPEPVPMPRSRKGNATYPIATGHLIAARKDNNNQWWMIDSRNPGMVDIPLVLLQKDFHLIVPENILI
ncbi:hypothetical protein PHSC3_001696 [Chlamydiales bacterium STE3]|nr:hypothetical protein PHSC3_001696 [Chlamydiales bacterium STE3]